MTDSKIPPGLQAELLSLLAPLEAAPSTIEGCVQIKWRGVIYHVGKKDLSLKDSINVTALWIRSDGPIVQLLAEIDGKFRLIREESTRRPFTSIIRSAAFKRSPIEGSSA